MQPTVTCGKTKFIVCTVKLISTSRYAV